MAEKIGDTNGPGSAAGGTSACAGAPSLRASTVSTRHAHGNTTAAAASASGLAGANLRPSADIEGIQRAGRDEKPRETIDLLTTLSPAGMAAFTRLINSDQTTVTAVLRTRPQAGRPCSSTTMVSRTEAVSAAPNGETKSLPSYAGGVPGTSTLLAADRCNLVCQAQGTSDLLLGAQYPGCNVTLLRSISEEKTDELVEEALDAVEGQKKDRHGRQSSKQDQQQQGCKARSQSRGQGLSQGQEQGRMADSRCSLDTIIRAPIRVSGIAAAEVAASGRVEQFEEASQVRKAPMICLLHVPLVC